MGKGFEQTFLLKRLRTMNMWKDAQHYQLLGKCKLNPQWDIIPYLLGWLLLKKKKNPQNECWLDTEKFGLPVVYALLVEKQNGAITTENSMAILKTTKKKITRISTSGCKPKRTESSNLKRYLYTRVPCSTTHNRQKVEAIHIDDWINNMC